MGLVFKARRNPIVSGEEEMIGALGEVLEDFDQLGKVRVHSEIWTARSDTPMHKGEKAKVESMDGLTLVIKPQKISEKPSCYPFSLKTTRLTGQKKGIEIDLRG